MLRLAGPPKQQLTRIPKQVTTIRSMLKMHRSMSGKELCHSHRLDDRRESKPRMLRSFYPTSIEHSRNPFLLVQPNEIKEQQNSHRSSEPPTTPDARLRRLCYRVTVPVQPVRSRIGWRGNRLPIIDPRASPSARVRQSEQTPYYFRGSLEQRLASKLSLLLPLSSHRSQASSRRSVMTLIRFFRFVSVINAALEN